MKYKRLCFTLYYLHGSFCLSRNYRLQKLGNLEWLVNKFGIANLIKGVDEVILVNCSSDLDDVLSILPALTRFIDKPLTIAGGINSLHAACAVFSNGADRIGISSSLTNLELIRSLCELYGSQSIVAWFDYSSAIDSTMTGLKGDEAVRLIFSLCSASIVGEILLNSVDHDGASIGFELGLLSRFRVSSVSTPVILSGGAGKSQHFFDAFTEPSVQAVSSANLLAFTRNGLPNLRRDLISRNINLPRHLDYDNNLPLQNLY